MKYPVELGAVMRVTAADADLLVMRFRRGGFPWQWCVGGNVDRDDRSRSRRTVLSVEAIVAVLSWRPRSAVLRLRGILAR